MISIDYKDRRPLYEQIVDKFKILIVNNVIKENEAMPSVRNLANSLSINPNTIQKAYGILESEGYIYTVLSKGSFVASNNDLIEKKKNEIKENIEKNIKEAKKYNINKKEISKIIQIVYGG